MCINANSSQQGFISPDVQGDGHTINYPQVMLKCFFTWRT